MKAEKQRSINKLRAQIEVRVRLERLVENLILKRDKERAQYFVRSRLEGLKGQQLLGRVGDSGDTKKFY